MRVTIFDDEGNPLACGQVDDLTINGQALHVNVSADIIPSWHALPEGGHSALAGMIALMEHIVANGKASVRYSSIKYSSSPTDFKNYLPAGLDSQAVARDIDRQMQHRSGFMR